MSPDERAPLIDRYREGPAAVREALAGITDDELDRRTAPEEWTAREVVHHLADSEMTSAIRLRTLLADDHPMIQGYDEQAFASRFTLNRPIAASLKAFEAARETSGEILEHLAEGDWGRSGTHSESGAYDVETWLRIYAAHAHDHADQIRRARSG